MIRVEDRGAPTTVIAFCGLNSPNHIFEFAKSVDEFDANFIGVKDDYDCWWQWETIRLADALLDEVIRLGGHRLVTVGHSAGGFGAILFGRWFDADRIVAFSPQTVCGRGLDGWDNRWPRFTAETPETQFNDLTRWEEYPTAEIHYAEDSDLDTKHAKRITARWVRTCAEGGHRLPQILRAVGALKPILAAAIEGRDPDPAVILKKVP